MARAHAFTRPCPVERTAAIVICGHNDAGSLTATAAFDAPGDCGPTSRRRCTKREARSQGYGGGRDPLSLGRRLGARLLLPA